jgi:hypothetical protein
MRAASQRLGVPLTEHDVMVTRARSPIERLDQRLAQAKANADLQLFNIEYGRRRLAARDAGEKGPTARPSDGCAARSSA